MQDFAAWHKGIHWPERCAVCDGKADRLLAVQMSAVSGVAIGIPHAKIQSKVTQVRHPVCDRHYWRTWIASGLSQRSLVTLGLGVIAVCLLLQATLQIASLGSADGHAAFKGLGWSSVLGLAYGLLFWFLYFWAKRNTPVKIAGASREGLLIRITNDGYAQRFSELNRHNIGSSLAWLKTEKNRVAEQGDLARQAGMQRSANPYRAPNTAHAHEVLAGYWDRGFDVAEKRGRTPVKV